MGKTYKDQHKYDKKHRDREEKPMPRKERRPHFDEVIPPDDELDPYEELDYDYDYDR